MKITNKLVAVALVSAAVSSCADLDTEYLGGYVTTEQKEAVLEKTPNMALAGVTGCFAAFQNSNFVTSNLHYDFGYASAMIMLDSRGQDLIGKNSGYNWYRTVEALRSPNDTGDDTELIWDCVYKQIGVANDVLASIPAETEDAQLKFFRAQALGVRAFDYWVLAQLYQFNYSVNASAPCVPIITELNRATAGAEGAPRASVQEVYDQILSDINSAIEMLESSGITPAQVLDSKSKRMISLAVAYGLRARAYLSMHKYAEAASDAQAAINNFSGRPFTREEVSHPTFTDIDETSWMWGIAMAETDRPVTSGIINFPSHMGSFNYGYCQYGGWRWINYNLFQSIPETDVRKGWWVDANFNSPNLTEAQYNYLVGYVIPSGITYEGETSNRTIMPYTQVKYDSYKGVLGQSTNASDIPLMRIEEMYLTLAEAKAMSGSLAEGKTVLEDFVKTYRDPAYTCAATTTDEMQEECWHQRRIELWGEGLSYFDLMRLNKGIDRVGALFPDDFTYRINPGDNVLLLCIPLDEITSNKQISSSDNNPNSVRPTPVKE